ncbi:MAG TPA: glycosyl hydrolase, partial [Solirubrobacterales bacterium]|nr:glycosyl hydrolase [Solirubrobacterales bacterium]
SVSLDEPARLRQHRTMVQGGLARLLLVCLVAGGLLLSAAASASAALYFGATISGETYGGTGNAPNNVAAWDLFERHAGKKVAILNQSQEWVAFDKKKMDATAARGAIPLVTMGLGAGMTLEAVVNGSQDAAIKKWAQEAKAWGKPFLFAPWWEMNGTWYPWGRSPSYVAAWRRFHDLVVAEGATNVTWTWVVNSIWFDPESNPTPYYPGDAYVDWTGLDSYNWGRNPAQPDKWITPEQTITPTLKIIREVAPTKPVAIVENASSEFGGNKADWVREMLETYLPHHPEIKAYLWFNWPFLKGDNRSDWPIESSAPAQQQFRRSIQSGLYVPGPVSLPALTKVAPPGAPAAFPPQAADLSTAAEMASGPDVAVAADGTATVVWSARSGANFRVFARRIDADGRRGATVALSAIDNDALDPQIDVAPDGTAVVAWTRSDGANLRVQERRIGPGGTPEDATRTLSGSGQHALDPEVAVAPDGAALVVWKRFDGFHYLVQSRLIESDGTAEGTSQRLSEQKQDAVEPQVAVAPDGTATVVWSRFDGADSVVQARRVGPDGTPAATTANLSAAGESAIQPRLEVDADGNATVVWNRFDGASWIVQTRRLSPAGTPGVVRDLSATGRSAAEPQLALGPEGEATVVWDRFDGTGFVVQARRLSATGAIASLPLNLSAAGADAAEPAVNVAPSGTATVLWSRFDGANFVVQGREVGAGGTLGVTEGLSLPGRGASNPALAWGEDGTLATVWRRFDGGGDVVQAKTVPLPPPPPPDPEPEPEGGEPEARTAAPVPAPAIDNSFQIERVLLNRRRGTATVRVAVPGPGGLDLAGAVPRSQTVDGAGTFALRVVPRPAKRRLLNRDGTVRLRLTVTFEPGGGTPNSRRFSVRLRKNPS